MKVWLLLSRLGHGGLERVQLNLAKAMYARGIDVKIVAGKVLADHSRELPEKLSIFEISRAGRLHFFSGLVKSLVRDMPEIIFTTSNDVACLLLLLRAVSFKSIRIVVTQHLSISGPRLDARGFKRIKLEAIRWLMSMLLRKADHLIAVSHGVAEDMCRELSLPNSAITVIYNPIVTSDFNQHISEATIWPWPDHTEPTLIFVGRLSAEKRLDLLLDTFKSLIMDMPARLLIVGSGPLYEEIRCKVETLEISGQCKLLGFISNPLPLIRASNLLVLPSEYEGFGNVLIEAMACGTQVIATDCPHGPAEILEFGKYGQLSPRGDSKALEVAIRRSLSREFWVSPSDLNARAQEFGLERSVSAYERIIRSFSLR